MGRCPKYCILGRCPYGREGSPHLYCPYPNFKEKIQREKGYLNFIGKDGYIWAAPMKHNKTGIKKKVSTEKVGEKCKFFIASAKAKRDGGTMTLWKKINEFFKR
jgi:hypothetical protein